VFYCGEEGSKMIEPEQIFRFDRCTAIFNIAMHQYNIQYNTNNL